MPGEVVDLAFAPPTPPEVETELGDDAGAIELDEPALDVGPVPVISEQQLRDTLDGAGRALSVRPLNLGVPNLWRFDEDELDGLVPPLCRVVNRRPPLARAVAKGDEVFVILQLAGYFGKRSDLVLEARRAARTEETPSDNGQREDRRAAAGTDAAMGRFPGATIGSYPSSGGVAAPPS